MRPYCRVLLLQVAERKNRSSCYSRPLGSAIAAVDVVGEEEEDQEIRAIAEESCSRVAPARNRGRRGSLMLMVGREYRWHVVLES